MSNELLKVSVNENTEKKGNLTYLSWAWAWTEVLKADSQATWIVHTYGPQGAEQPCMWIGDTAMVHTSVTIFGLRRECLLPVMDHKNNAMKNPDARKISDAIMRCMTKAISMHGLGLYIYAGEDLPEGDKPEAAQAKVTAIPSTFKSSPTMGVLSSLTPARQAVIADYADSIGDRFAKDDVIACFALYSELEDAEEKTALWSKLDSKCRAAIKKHGEFLKSQLKEAA